MNTRLDSPGSDYSLKARILNALPAATYQMDRFLSLIDIVISDLAPTACVDSGPQPKMHVNPEFIAKHCRHDEQLLMLILHELYHVILGHTQLFPRPTEAHNIAFDAYINALLCHQFKDNPLGLEFIRSVNGTKNFPARLLRPPVGWPGRFKAGRDRSPEEVRVMKALYGEKPNNITYQEILDLLKTNPPLGVSGEVVLLGDHSGEGKAGEKDEEAAKSEILTGVLRDVVKAWPKKAKADLDKLGRKERGDGGGIEDFLMPKAETPRREFLSALTKLLSRAGALRSYSPNGRRWKKTSVSEEMNTVFPDIKDRLAQGREMLWGKPPILFKTSTVCPRRRLIPKEAVHLYLDVSGSMSNELPWLASALNPLERNGAINLYAFSTIVSKVPKGGLKNGSIKNTYGTDINCVFAHIHNLPKRKSIRQAVVLTDGYVGTPNEGFLNELKNTMIHLHFGLIGPHLISDWMRLSADSIMELPSTK